MKPVVAEEPVARRRICGCRGTCEAEEAVVEDAAG